MLSNYFTIAWRNLLRSKTFSIINITGLAIGMAAVLLIGIWVQNELSFDRFHTNIKNLYKLYNKSENEGMIGVWDVTAGPAGKTLQKDFPEVKSTARVYWSTDRLFNYGDKSLKAKGNEVDKSFLTMFTFPLLQGNASHALDEVNNIVITQSLAQKLFGNTEAFGKVVKLDNQTAYKVTGVVKDLPANTEFNFDYLVSLAANENMYGNNWMNNSFYTYVQLKPDVNIEAFNKKIKNELIKYAPETKASLFLYPYSQQHLYSYFENGVPVGGRVDTVRLLMVIAGLILLIACINFMNLSTARSEKRAKEVGVRKVIGAGRGGLISLFLSESILMTCIAGIISLILVQLLLPVFNQLVNESLVLNYANPLLWISLFLFIVLTGLLAGSYPAFFLSSFKPVSVLKGLKNSSPKVLSLRKVLVVIQFAVAIILTISTIIVYRQIKYVQTRNTGYSANQLIEIPIEGDIAKNYNIIKNELLSQGVVAGMCRNSLGLTIDAATSSGYSWPGSTEADKNTNFSRVGSDADFTKTTGMTLLAGRDINMEKYPYDTSSVMVNEAAVTAMRLGDPIGKEIDMNGKKRTIVGVFKNFIIGSPYQSVNPMVVLGTDYWLYNIILRLNNQNSAAKNLQSLTEAFKKYNPAYPFTYHFVDDEYASKFTSEQQTGTMAAVFAGLTIFISCLGLFGLAAYLAESRVKEIGIRKVLGASAANIVQMLSKEFVALVLIAILIASPLGWYFMNSWLQSYYYRISIGWEVFVLAGITAVAIAVLTVSLQAIKAALANPVKSLRTE